MPFLATHRLIVGEWLSLVEHLVRDQGVGGSNPLSPTNFHLVFARVLDARRFPSSSRFSYGATPVLAGLKASLSLPVAPLGVQARFGRKSRHVAH
jgi:hypothetical protein